MYQHSWLEGVSCRLLELSGSVWAETGEVSLPHVGGVGEPVRSVRHLAKAATENLIGYFRYDAAFAPLLSHRAPFVCIHPSEEHGLVSSQG